MLNANSSMGSTKQEVEGLDLECLLFCYHMLLKGDHRCLSREIGNGGGEGLVFDAHVYRVDLIKAMGRWGKKWCLLHFFWKGGNHTSWYASWSPPPSRQTSQQGPAHFMQY